MSSPITTHILDTSTGRPATGVPVILHALRGGSWEAVGHGTTNDDGRVADLLTDEQFSEGHWRLRFATGVYFARTDTKGFYPYVEIVFDVQAKDEHYHVPLLLNPFGYSTYRGS
jgi:5-hydroxyisourate hydrolase